MALQTQAHRKQNQTKKKFESKTEIEKTQRPLPMWCRGIMSGCVNCGGCV